MTNTVTNTEEPKSVLQLAQEALLIKEKAWKDANLELAQLRVTLAHTRKRAARLFEEVRGLKHIKADEASIQYALEKANALQGELTAMEADYSNKERRTAEVTRDYQRDDEKVYKLRLAMRG